MDGPRKQRGFTDDEFRLECEAAAGTSLADVLGYASTTVDVDYAKYFALAGLGVTVTAEDGPGTSIGLNTQTRGGALIVVSTTPGSASATAGLAAGDHVVDVNGVAATPKSLTDLLVAGMPGDRLRLTAERAGVSRGVEVTLDRNTKRTFSIMPAASPTARQAAVLADWLRSSPGGRTR